MTADRPGAPRRVLAWSDSDLFSGAEAVFAAVVTSLARDHGFDVVAAASEGNERLRGLLGAAGIECLVAPSQPGSLAAVHLWDPRRLASAASVVRAARADAVVANLPSVELGGTPALVGRRRRTVGLLHIHHRLGRLPFRAGRARSLLSAPVLRRFDDVLCAAPNAPAEVVSEWSLAAERVGFLPYPRPAMPPDDGSRDARRARLGLREDDVAVGLVGRLSIKQKGHDVALRALGAVRAAEPRVRLVLVGDGPDADELRGLAGQLGVSSHVIFAGPTTPAAAAMRALDLVALPSRFEGLPLVALEALELGLPGASSDVDGLGAVWPPAWTAPADDVEGFAAALLTAIRSTPERRREAIDAARRRAMALTTDDPGAAVARVLRAPPGSAATASPVARTPA